MSLTAQITLLAQSVGTEMKKLGFRRMIYGRVNNLLQTNGNTVAPGVNFSINTASFVTNDSTNCSVNASGIAFTKTGIVLCGLNYYFQSSLATVTIAGRLSLNGTVLNFPIPSPGLPSGTAPREAAISGVGLLEYPVANQRIIWNIRRTGAVGTTTATVGNSEMWCLGFFAD